MDEAKKLIINIARFLAKGKLIMWVYTINMIALSWYATVKGIKIDSSVAMMYGTCLGAYGITKGYEFYHTQKNGGQAPTGPAGRGVE